MKKRATPPEELERASATLLALLRSPKSKAGLCAAVAEQGLSIHFITGWLSRQMKAGIVIPVQQVRGSDGLFVLSQSPDLPIASPSDYPPWLEPRHLPRFDTRYLVSMLEGNTEQQQEDERTHHEKEKPTARRPQRRTQCSTAGR